MSEVKQPVEHMSTGRPEAGAYYAELYNTAQFELSVLREELAKVNREKNDVAYRANETAERLNSMTISKATMQNKLKQKLISTQQRLTAAEQRNVELHKAHDEQQLLALVRLSDLHDNNGEFEKLYDLLRNCYPFVRARCEATDFGDASARATLEMIDAAFKRIELKPTESEQANDRFQH